LKIVFYNNKNEVIEVLENIQDLFIENNNIKWDQGEMTGIQCNFSILDDMVEVSETITESQILSDKKEKFIKVDLIKENAELKANQELMQLVLDELIMGSVF
jgi:hypothetical protein